MLESPETALPSTDRKSHRAAAMMRGHVQKGPMQVDDSGISASRKLELLKGAHEAVSHLGGGEMQLWWRFRTSACTGST